VVNKDEFIILNYWCTIYRVWPDARGSRFTMCDFIPSVVHFDDEY